MKTKTGYELELHHAQHIEEQMRSLHKTSIPLSVPSIGETLLINASKMPESRPIVLEIENPAERMTIYRTDMNIDTRMNMPLQIQEADPRNAKFGHELFATAVESITYARTGDFAWNVDVDEENINDTQMFREFTGILTRFAQLRQEKLI